MAILSALIGPVTGILDKFVEDKDQKARLAHEISTMAENHAQQLVLSQIEVNKIEAASASTWKGGWRPFVGWVCGVAFAYHFVLQPLVVFIIAVYGIELIYLPEFEMGQLMTVLMGMLGLGGLRSFEKTKGVAK